jgi:hypothetical protein
MTGRGLPSHSTIGAVVHHFDRQDLREGGIDIRKQRIRSLASNDLMPITFGVRSPNVRTEALPLS